jgi:DNA polymerase-3 subunit gamma/tau
MMEENGRYNIASILRIDKPKLNNETIEVTLPNSTNKIELESVKTEMLEYFRDNLKNKDIYLTITVDEGIQEKFIYTDKDKYDLMRKKNPNIEVLKDTFNLSI